MPDYSKGLIYTIRSRNDNIKIYVGSTTQPLYKRFYQHKKDSQTEKYINKKLYIEVNNDWDNWYIELYENYPCNNKNELCKREGEVIREIGTLNKFIAGRDIKQYRIENTDKIKEKNKLYRIENANKIKEYKKQYQIKNADKIKEHQKEYRIENADKKKEHNKQYYTENADKIKENNAVNAEKLKQYQKEYRLKKKIENADKL